MMNIKVVKQNNWLIYQCTQDNLNPKQIQHLQTIVPNKILRDHHRSLVQRVEADNQQYVIKKPHNKNRSLWIRLTTLYRDSEVVRDLKSQLLLKTLNINTVTPIAALEQRKFGLVIDSIIIYEYKPGTYIAEDKYPKMIEIMNSLHHHGYLHDDPHTKNFLHDDEEVFVIDCKPRRNYLGKFGVAYNNLTLARRTSEKTLIYQLIRNNPDSDSYYRIANLIINLQQIRRSLKNKLRKILGIEHKRNTKKVNR